MRLSRIVVLLALVLMVSMPARADLKKGDKEVTASFSYSTQDFDDSDVELTDTQLDVDFGYLLTERHEVGGRLQWFKTELEPGGFDADGTSSITSTSTWAGRPRRLPAPSTPRSAGTRATSRTAVTESKAV